MAVLIHVIIDKEKNTLLIKAFGISKFTRLINNKQFVLDALRKNRQRAPPITL